MLPLLSIVLSVVNANPNLPELPQHISPFSETAKEILRNSTLPNDRPFLVDLGSRIIAPGIDNSYAVKGSRASVYIQFQNALTSSQRKTIRKYGVQFLGLLNQTTYISNATPQALEKLKSFLGYRGVSQVLYTDKLTKGIFTNNVNENARDEKRNIKGYVHFHSGVSKNAAITALQKTGIKVIKGAKLSFGNRLQVSFSHNQAKQLANSPLVKWINQLAPPPTHYNSASAQISNVDVIKSTPFNLDGNGVIGGIWDGGPVLAVHQDLTGRVTIQEAGTVSDHATHVAGTIMSSGANNLTAEGMASGLPTLHSYDFNGAPVTEQNTAVTNFNIIFSNHSWGSRTGYEPDINTDFGEAGFGVYDTRANGFDQLIRNTNLIVSVAAGNDRNDCSPAAPAGDGDCDGTAGTDGQQYDLLNTHGTSKNVITVGAIQDNGTTIAAFSSSGPTDDGRIKPDVVANGVTLTSTCIDPTTPPDLSLTNIYCSKGGTSMATPTVSGIVALLVERYRTSNNGITPTPDIIKALLVNTASDLGRPGPDYLYGHGLVNAEAAVNVIDVAPIRIITDAVDQNQVDTFLLSVPEGLTELRVTGNWLDIAGLANSGAADIIHNLDVSLTAPDNTVFFPFSGTGNNYTALATANGLNTLDTVESIIVDSPEVGIWEVQVQGTAVGAGPQNYALVANTPFNLPNQPEISVNAALDYGLGCNGNFKDIVVSVFNTGGGDLHVHNMTVTGSDFSLLDDPALPVIITAGSHVDFTVRFSPGITGSKAGILNIVSNDVDEASLDFAITGEVGEGDLTATMEANGQFGDVMIASTKVLSLDLLNQGTCDIVISDAARDSGSTDFEDGALAGTLNFPVTLGAGSNLDVPIEFTPSSFGNQTAKINIVSSDSDTPNLRVDVIGNSSVPVLTVSGELGFGQVCGGTTEQRTIEICNTGPLNTLEDTSASLGTCDDFEIVGNPFPADVSHDFCMPLDVIYTPTEVGAHSCQLTITSKDVNSPAVINLSGETPTNSLAALNNIAFPATVIQENGPGVSSSPLPVVNNGVCPVTVTATTASPDVYTLSGLPDLPVPLMPGEQLGDGALDALFKPTTLARHTEGVVTVTYEHDPIMHLTTDISNAMCGEGVHTGARVLVTNAGIPVDNVIRLQLQRINANRNGNRGGKVDSIETAKNLPAISVNPSANGVCEGFVYHREYGTVSNPVQLLTGSYQLTAVILQNGKRKTKTAAFSVDTIDFNRTIEITF